MSRPVAIDLMAQLRQSLETHKRAKMLAKCRTHWSQRDSITLSDLYDPDARAVSPVIADVATRMMVPHPLSGVTYADGVAP